MNIQQSFAIAEEKILQCMQCKTNVFYLISADGNRLVECAGCGVKKELNGHK